MVRYSESWKDHDWKIGDKIGLGKRYVDIPLRMGQAYKIVHVSCDYLP